MTSHTTTATMTKEHADELIQASAKLLAAKALVSEAALALDLGETPCGGCGLKMYHAKGEHDLGDVLEGLQEKLDKAASRLQDPWTLNRPRVQ